MRVDVENLEKAIKGLKHFDRLLSLSDDKATYVVGGAVRDALIGTSVTDVDLVTATDPTALAKNFARQIGGSWFWLDESRLQSRVVVNNDDNCPDYDFAPFRAPTLGQDLLDRDFTINAIALPLLAEERLIDPLCGLDDLQKDVLRMVSEKSLTDDPLRILKGIRHATVLGLDVEAETLHCMQKEVTGLYHVSPERIRQEVWKIFGSRNASGGLQLLSQSNAGNYLFGNDFLSSVDLLSKGLERLRYKLQKIAREQPVVNCWLAEEIEQGLSLRTTLLWTTLLIQLDRTLPLRLADEWLLSRKAKGYIAAIGNIDENVLEEFFAIPFRERPFLWWAFQKRIEPKLLLLVVALNDSENPSFDELVAKWIPLVNDLERGQPEALVDGRWLRTELGLEDGPEMSRAHQLLRHAEVAGQVDNPESARRFLRHHYANID